MTESTPGSAARPLVVFEIVRIDRGLYTWHFEYGSNAIVGYGNRGAAIEAADKWVKRHGGSSVIT